MLAIFWDIFASFCTLYHGVTKKKRWHDCRIQEGGVNIELSNVTVRESMCVQCHGLIPAQWFNFSDEYDLGQIGRLGASLSMRQSRTVTF